MSEYHIKLAEHFDLPDIIEILEELNLDMEDLDEDDWMVAVVKDEIVGVGRLRFYDDACELSSVGVLEDFRQQGIGKAIIQALVSDASNVYTVTEIPAFFALSGFKARSEMVLPIESELVAAGLGAFNTWICPGTSLM